MAAHTLLCVEPDEATLATIRGALEPHGFRITNITNGEEAVAWGRENLPALVIVSVEPRKVGYAICNKFKRSPELKDIPLILASGEETPQQLEQHRKLKVKANEYLVKPFSARELLDKVREVFPLDSGDGAYAAPQSNEGSEDEDILLSSEVLEELSIGDSDIVGGSDADDVDEVIVEAGDFEDESTQAVSPQSLNVFDQETDAAFAAIALPAPTSTPSAGDANAPWTVDPAGWDDEATSAADIREEEVEDALAKLTEPDATRGGLSGRDLFASTEMPTRAVMLDAADSNAHNTFGANFGDERDENGRPTPTPPAPKAAPPFASSNPFDDDDGETPSPAFADAPRSNTAEAPALDTNAGFDGPRVAASESSASETASLRLELSRLQQQLEGAIVHNEKLAGELSAAADARGVLAEERDTLSREIDEIKSRPQSAASARDREILNLREVINKKERDLLDFRDQLDARERQILDHKDRIRENERSRRDLEDKNLGLEKALMDTNERIEALTGDKQKSAERERVVKARLDDAHVEIQKAHDEVESLKKRAQATEERLRGEMDRMRGELEGRILETEEAHRNELAHAAQERANFDAAAEQEHREALARLRSAHAAELENTLKKATEEFTGLDERMQLELARTRKDHDKSVSSLKEEHALQLAAEREAHQGALEGKERDHRNEILGMRRRHEDELRASDERRQKELEEQDIRFKIELDATENRRRAELQARDEQHSVQVADMDRRHFEEKTKTSERHRSDMDDANARAARAEGDLAARTEELSEAHRRIAGIEADLDSTRADLRDRDVKLSQGNLRVAELETKTTQYEEQIMRSYQRLRSDDKVIEKAKRALAVALSLLEERGMAPAQAQSGDQPGSEPTESNSPDSPTQEVLVTDGGPS